MIPERWQQIARIYDSVIDREPTEHGVLLDEACGTDQGLRREVESLLSQESVQGPLDSDVMEVAAELLEDPSELAAGMRLGPYRIDAIIGAGGMGQVYAATDTRLGRRVAIKILPAAIANNTSVRLRFEREARTIASLTHPHICTLYDVGREKPATDGADDSSIDSEQAVDFLVMEFLEGETLAARLGRAAEPEGSPIQVEEALRVAIEIADALAAAHRHGIVHRDLKPGNIMLARRGGPSGPPAAKLLDFGLATTAPPIVPGATGSMLSTSPASLTGHGAIVGTFQYMAPEQLQGKPADARTDIFAFGVVVYEMVTGQKAFAANSQAGLIGAILKDTPAPMAASQPLVPPLLDHIVARCLAKDPDERWQSAADLMRELKWTTHEESPTSSSSVPRDRQGRQHRLFRPVSVVASTAFGAAVVAAAWWYSSSRPVTLPMYRASIALPEGVSMTPISPTSRFALSPDGRRIAFVAQGEDGRVLLYVRPLDALNADAVVGTEGAALPFWSPDSRFLGFVADGKLKRVEFGRSSTLVITDRAASAPAAWNRDGVILFTPTRTSPLHRVSMTGGLPAPVTTLDAASGDSAHVAPFFLPDHRHFLYTVIGRKGAPSEARAIFVGSLDPAEKGRLLLAVASNGAYANGRLLFMRESTLMAQPFDPGRLQLSGEPSPAAEHVTIGGYFAYRQAGAFSVSDSGTLAYQGGETWNQLTWFDRTGRKVGVLGGRYDEDSVATVSLSPDATQTALAVRDRARRTSDIWRYDTRGLTTRFTFDPADEFWPTWSPDGKRIAFASNRKGHFDLFERSTAGGDDEVVLEDDGDKFPVSWSGDGRFLLYMTNPSGELWALPLIGARKAFAIVRAPISVQTAQFSPDGRWIAYVSAESGQSEVYVVSFPGGAHRTRISTNGGTGARWKGGEIFYRASGVLKAVEVSSTTGSFTVGAATPIMDVRTSGGGFGRSYYDVTPDGQRFLVNMRVGEVGGSITLVVNSPTALGARTPSVREEPVQQ